MRLILLTAMLVFATAAPAAESGRCDAKPFTLNKPAAPRPQQAKATAPTTTQAAPKPAPKPKAKLKSAIGCAKPAKAG